MPVKRPSFWENFHDEELRRLFFAEHPEDSANSITVVSTKSGNVSISVSDEKAVGSYNENFECTISLPREEAEKLAQALAGYLQSHKP